MGAFKELTRAVTIRHNDKIRRACSHLFKSLNLCNFWHYRITNSGSYYYLGTNIEVSEFFDDQEIYLNYPYYRHPKFFRTGVSLMRAVPDEDYIEFQKKLKNKFNHHHPLLLINQIPEGVEGFGFGSNTENPQQIALLINELPLLRLFCMRFREENQILFTQLKDNQVDLARVMGASFYVKGPPVLPSPKIDLSQKMGLKPVSTREKEILKLLIQGLPASQIALRIHRSKRTIEHHLERLKDKLGCDSKTALIQKGRELEQMGHFYGVLS